MKVEVQKDQNLIDFAVTNYGSDWINGLLQILEHNDISLAEQLEAGQELEVKHVNENDLSLRYMKARKILVATGNTDLAAAGDEIPYLVDHEETILIDQDGNELVYE